MGKIISGLIYTGIIAVFFSGCAVATHEEAVESIRSEEVVQEKVPETFAAHESQGIVDDGWLKTFDDPKLVMLVGEALANNPGLKIAQAQVDRAETVSKQADTTQTNLQKALEAEEKAIADQSCEEMVESLAAEWLIILRIHPYVPAIRKICNR